MARSSPQKRTAAAEPDSPPTKRVKSSQISEAQGRKARSRPAVNGRSAAKSSPRSIRKARIKESQALNGNAGSKDHESTASSNPIRKSKAKANGSTHATGNGAPAVKKHLPDSEQDSERGASSVEDKPSQVKTKRKSKADKEAEIMANPLAARSQNLRMFIGAHVSAAGGPQNAIKNAVNIGGNAFALFLKSQRKWDNPPLQDAQRNEYHQLAKEHRYESTKHVLPHGSYLVNLAQQEAAKAQQAYSSFVDDLKRCEALGIRLYNFHPGNTGSCPRPEAISRIASALNRAHGETQAVVTVLENMAGGKNTIGWEFEDLRDIIAQVKDRSRIGVCFDTCHGFAAGYDLRTPDAWAETFTRFDRIIGLRYLRAVHVNDSKAPFGSHRDLHQNIGHGFLGLRAFHNLMNDRRFEDLPLVLETPNNHKDAKGKMIEDKGVWAREIKLLESLIGMDPAGDEFKRLESDLAAKGADERKKYQDSYDRKQAKENGKSPKKSGKGRAGRKAMAASDSSENDSE